MIENSTLQRQENISPAPADQFSNALEVQSQSSQEDFASQNLFFKNHFRKRDAHKTVARVSGEITDSRSIIQYVNDNPTTLSYLPKTVDWSSLSLAVEGNNQRVSQQIDAFNGYPSKPYTRKEFSFKLENEAVSIADSANIPERGELQGFKQEIFRRATPDEKNSYYSTFGGGDAYGGGYGGDGGGGGGGGDGG